MSDLGIKFLGTGDAFGHGGRLQTCILLEDGNARVLLDCGASAMISLHRYLINPNSIEAVLLTHLHGDHFGGLPFFILDAQLHSKRELPLTIAGPAGTGPKLSQAMECMFPGSSKVQRKFVTRLEELEPGQTWRYKDIEVTAYEVVHASGAPALALRINWGGKIIAYTGDSQWTETLVPLAQNADLLIAEAYFYEKPIKYHLSYRTLREHLPELQAKKLVLTHMSQDMLDRLPEAGEIAAEDGMELKI